MKARPAREFDRVAALGDEVRGRSSPSVTITWAKRVDHRDIGAGQQWQVIVRLDMRRAHDVGAARIDDDELGALAQPPLHARGEDRMPVGRVGADDDDDVGLVDAT